MIKKAINAFKALGSIRIPKINIKKEFFNFLDRLIKSIPIPFCKTVDPKSIEVEVLIRRSDKNWASNNTKGLEIELSKLTESQMNHYAAVSWLTNPFGPRGSGRTHLMALSFIEHSLQNRGVWIKVFDHFSGSYGEEMINKVQDIINNCPALELETKRYHIKVNVNGSFVGYDNLKKI